MHQLNYQEDSNKIKKKNKTAHTKLHGILIKFGH